eukprot:gi/632954355/ref/XP_007892914.1/ PREDICTED: LOW QUALITY PROTEIN: polycystic kidney disease and receptor for egg jelly-related protein [Callorhinchus milii]
MGLAVLLVLCLTLVGVEPQTGTVAPPMELQCPQKELHLLDSPVSLTCVWASTVTLTYRPSASVPATGDPPTCRWAVADAPPAITRQWSGAQTLATPNTSSVITVNYTSASCPECRYRQIRVSLAAQAVLLFALTSPRSPAVEFEDLGLVWCALFKSEDWSYLLSCAGGSPASLNLSSPSHSPLPAGGVPADERAQCSGRYAYVARVHFPRAGSYSCALSSPAGPALNLSLAHSLEPELMGLLSATSGVRNLRSERLRLSWRLDAASPLGVSYELASQAPGSQAWNVTRHRLAAPARLCAAPRPLAGQQVARALLLLRADSDTVRASTGIVRLERGVLSVDHRGSSFSLTLHPTLSVRALYYVDGTNALYYTKTVPPRLQTEHSLLLRDGDITHFFRLDYRSADQYVVTVQLYLNRRANLYLGTEAMGASLSLYDSGSARPGGTVSLVWFIPAQHPMIRCGWSFALNVSRASGAVDTTTYGYGQAVREAQTHIPRVTLRFDPRLYAGFVARVRCSAPARRSVRLTASVGSYRPQPADSEILCVRDACETPHPVIQKPLPPQKAIIARKGYPFDVYAEAGLSCRVIVSVRLTWQVYRVPNLLALPAQNMSVALPSNLLSNIATLHVPLRTFDTGLYLFDFHVNMTISDPNVPFLQNSDQVHVRVTSSELVALIAGGSYRIVASHRVLVLDGYESADPDSASQHESLVFTWYCTTNPSDYKKMILSSRSQCLRRQRTFNLISGIPQILNIIPRRFRLDKIYHFRLVIKKDNRESYFDQIIKVVSGTLPETSIECIENCEKYIIPTERFILSGICTNCSDSLKYEWSLLSGDQFTKISFDWSNTATGRSLVYISVNAKTFLGSQDTLYVFELKITRAGGTSGTARYVFNVNAPPKIGACSITPKRGIALRTKFTVRCSGFYDSNGPLRYKITAVAFYQSGTINTLQNKALGTIVYFGFEPISPPIVLPIGVSTGRRLLLIQVQVFDDLGAYSAVSLKVRVDDLTVDWLHGSIVDKLLTFVEGKTTPLTILLHGTDYVEVNQMYYIIGSVLNDRNFKGKELTKVIQFRETLLNGTVAMEITSPLLITQIAASIFEIAKKKNEVNKNSQVLAVRKLQDLSSSLYNYTLGNIGSESTESLSAGIMTAGANVMAAFLLPFPKGGTDAGVTLTSAQLEVTNKVFPTLRSLTESVSNGKVPGEINTFMKVKEWGITIKKNEKEEVEDSYFTDTNCLNCIYPSLSKTSSSGKDPVSSAVYEFKDNPLPWLGKSAHIVTDVTAFDMFVIDKNGQVKDLNPEELETILMRKVKVEPKRIKLAKDTVKTGVIIGHFNAGIDPSQVSEAFVQLVAEPNPIFEINIYSGKDSTKQSAAQTLIIPECESGETILKGRTFHIWDPYAFRIPINLFKKEPDNATGINYVTITVETNYPKAGRLLKRGIGISFFTANCLTFEGDSDKWHTSSCKTGILTNNERVHCICKSVRKKISRRQSRLLRFPWFLTASVLVLPELVDLYDTRKLLDTLPRNVVTIVTVIIIFLLYFIIAIWAFRKRKSDKASVSKVIVLLDNDPCETFCYLVTVYTGARPDSSTTADVFLTLVSKCFQSDVHHLKHPDHQIFLRAGVDTFLLTTEEDLGDLTSIRVWCKTAGHSPAWYLSRVKVQNVFTKKLWFFVCRKWFAAEKGDGLLDRTFPAVQPETRISRSDAFFIDFSTNIETDHLWFSVFSFKSDPSFTRHQRLACCLTMLLSSLLTSIMLYQKEGTGPFRTRLWRSLVIGIESALVMVPVQILIATLFVYAQKEKAKYAQRADAKHQYEEFQKAHYEIIQQEPKLDKSVQNKNWKDRLQKWYVDDEADPKTEGNLNEPTQAADDDIYNLLSYTAGLDKVENQPRKAIMNCTMPQSVADKITIDDTAAETNTNTKKYRSKSKHVGQHPPTKLKVNKNKEARHSLQSEGKVSLQWKEDKHSLQGEKERHSLKLEEDPLDSSNMVLHKKRSRLPFYVLYLAWFIVWSISITAAVFIILYGLHYGLLKSWHWLIASVTSFLQSVFILQPLKIAGFSLLYALRPRHAREIDWLTGANWLQTDVEKMYKIRDECCAIIPKEMRQHRAPNPDELIIAKRQSVIRTKALIFCIRAVTHLIFLVLLLYAISYEDYKNSFHYNQMIRIKFSEEFLTINTIEQVYTWMTATFLPLIHTDREHNFLTANNYHMIGLPRMRQIRSKQKSVPCFGKYNYMLKTPLRQERCHALFDISQQDKREYKGAWTSVVDKESGPVKDPLNYTGWIYENYRSPWFFSSRGDYHSYPLGGYAVYFSSNLQASVGLMESLHNASWIDRSTWAVIIETTIYNPNSDLFCTISVIFEMIPLGTVNRKLNVKSFSLRLFDRDKKNWLPITTVLILLLLIFVAVACWMMYQDRENYFKKVANLVNLVLVVLLLVTILLYVSKFILARNVINYYMKNPISFIPFHVISALDQLLRFNVAFLILITILKTLRYTRFLYNVRLAEKSIVAALPSIYSMALIAAIYFFIFVSFGHLVFGQFDTNYNTIPHAAQTIMAYCATTFQHTSFSYSRFLGGLFLGLFLVIMICILLNLFQAIFIQAYDNMKPVIYEQPSEDADVAIFLRNESKRFWYSLWKMPPKPETEYSNTLFFGEDHGRTLRLKNKEIKGKKINYLII